MHLYNSILLACYDIFNYNLPKGCCQASLRGFEIKTILFLIIVVLITYITIFRKLPLPIKLIQTNINKRKEGFAFLVHSRSYEDIFRKYPLTKKLPKHIVMWCMKNLPPITLSKVSGLVSVKDKMEVQGYVIGITMTASQMMSDRKRALKRIRQAVYLAKRKGVTIVGLGGLTSSLSKGGKDLLDIANIAITTGHAYTAYNVTQYVRKLVGLSGIPVEQLSIAIVGAAGSVGSLTASLVAIQGFRKITIIDTKQRFKELEELRDTILKNHSLVFLEIKYDISSIRDHDFVITATNAAHALVTKEYVSPGMILVDDAQPSDIHFEVLSMPDVLAIEAGVVHTPNVKSNFNYGLKNKTDNFCCMAELLLLAAHEYDKHFVINRATLEQVEIISAMGKEMGFDVGEFQNFKERISCDKINHVLEIARKKHGGST